jgi:predicted MFS family arabinose efflux permease
MVLLGSIGLGLAANPVLLALSRFLIGIGAAAWVVFPIFLVTFFTEDKIGQAVGMINFVTGLALVITSFLGGILAETRGERFVFFAAALIALAALSSLLLAKESVVMPKESFSLARFNQVTRRPLLIVVSIMAILVLFAYFSSVLGFMPVYAAKIGASDSGLGILTMMNMIGSMSGSLAAAPLVKRRGNVFTIVISALLLGLTLLAIPFIHNLPALGAVLLINGLGYGLLSTQLMVLSIFNISQQQRATAMGFYQSMYAIGMLSGPLVAGRLSERFGLPVVFYLGGALCLIVIGLAFLPVLPGRSKTAI